MTQEFPLKAKTIVIIPLFQCYWQTSLNKWVPRCVGLADVKCPQLKQKCVVDSFLTKSGHDNLTLLCIQFPQSQVHFPNFIHSFIKAQAMSSSPVDWIISSSFSFFGGRITISLSNAPPNNLCHCNVTWWNHCCNLWMLNRVKKFEIKTQSSNMMLHWQ